MNDIVKIKIADIVIVSNIRTQDSKAIAELAESIESVGLIQPITTTFDEEAEKYRLITGHRRVAAYIKLSLPEIEAILKPEMSDADIIAYQLIENIQRETVTIIEEAHSFDKLVKENHLTVKQIAKSIGKTLKYVNARLLLNNLTDDVSALVHSGTLTTQHALLFAQCTPDAQAMLLGRIRPDILKPEQVEGPRELKRLISQLVVHSLAGAPFDFEDAELVPHAGSCLKCPKRSGANKSLFDTVESEDDCFDPACYGLKIRAMMDKMAAQYQLKNIKVHFLTENWKPDSELEKKNLEWGYKLHTVDMPKGKPVKGFPLREVGIYIEAQNPEKNGTVVQVLNDEEWRKFYDLTAPKNNDSRPDNNESVSDEDQFTKEFQANRKNIEKFIKEITNAAALQVAKSDTIKLPDTLLRYLGKNLLESLDEEDQKEFIKHFGWSMEVAPQKALIR